MMEESNTGGTAIPNFPSSGQQAPTRKNISSTAVMIGVALIFLLACFISWHAGALFAPYTEALGIFTNGHFDSCLINGINTCESSAPNKLKVGNGATGTANIKITDPIELDNLTKKEVLGMRKKLVAGYDLVDGEYAPYAPLFGQIQDNAPWWGMDGLLCHGAGMKSIDGPSEESRDVANPYMLIVLDEGMAFSTEKCAPYPRPAALEWDAGRSQAAATYNMSDFVAKRKILASLSKNATNILTYFNEGNFTMSLIGINARDFGYQYAHIDAEKSIGISDYYGGRLTTDAVELRDFIHRGGSCGYPGGCNNLSPDNPEQDFTISKIPGTIYFKLWKSKPASTGQEADFTFIINLV